jgi:hypothetical protein
MLVGLRHAERSSGSSRLDPPPAILRDQSALCSNATPFAQRRLNEILTPPEYVGA